MTWLALSFVALVLALLVGTTVRGVIQSRAGHPNQASKELRIFQAATMLACGAFLIYSAATSDFLWYIKAPLSAVVITMAVWTLVKLRPDRRDTKTD